MMQKTEEGFFESEQDRVKLFYKTHFSKEQKERKNVVIVHGALEHSGRYSYLIKELTETGFNCFLFDLRGHGKSEGSRGDAGSFDFFLKDLDSFLNFIEEKHRCKTPFLIGHSLGGLISLNYLLEKKYRGRIKATYISAPALAVRLTLTMRVKQAIAKYLLVKIAPKLLLPVGLDSKYISHDKKELERYLKDPLVTEKLSVRLGLEILKRGKDTIERASQIGNFPLFLAHGEDDGISYSEGTKRFYQKLNSPQQKLKIYKHCYHELFNEREDLRKLVFKDLLEFFS